ncbi:protein-S-isoprenylcysteine O-methyltransferase [Ahrensia sp. R2A130]|uniref:protein-S-isoprenylcysteine O-methyltransferase n=1 Tax=Ahrensia sp. R2A130 TaxID=744979 RepID=UPI0001E0C9FA|nr:protein-S-isoprenylcysteine O-methyltransferase [Ahrensia sp. R2A130]EFL88806.1 isoprenylcysteine carboxyl methyltransferase [Ahrensia sp. R2A130]
MNAEIASVIWCLSIVFWLVIRWPHRRRARKTKVVTDQRSRAEWIALTGCTVGLVVIPAFHLATGLLSFADYPFFMIQGILGSTAMIGFLVLFHLSHRDLARNWSVTLEIREDHKLVDHGVYARVRHPMYTSFWLWGLGQALLIPNWIAGLTGLAAVAWLYFSRVNKEEAMMQAQFGPEYDAYRKRTARLVPGFV